MEESTDNLIGCRGLLGQKCLTRILEAADAGWALRLCDVGWVCAGPISRWTSARIASCCPTRLSAPTGELHKFMNSSSKALLWHVQAVRRCQFEQACLHAPDSLVSAHSDLTIVLRELIQVPQLLQGHLHHSGHPWVMAMKELKRGSGRKENGILSQTRSGL